MGFFEEHKKQIVMVLAVLLFVVSLLTAGKTTHIPVISGIANAVVTPLQRFCTNIGGWVGTKTSALGDADTLQKENENLKAQIKILEDKNARLSLYEEENKRLSALLDLSQKYPEYETEGVRIIAKDPGNWYDIFTVNKGKKDGLASNMVLIDGGGLVGKIIETSSSSAKAQSILDSRSSVPAMSLRTNDLGVVRGDYSLMDDGLCRMEYIDADAEIIKGDEIVTSQLSDIYPPGIVIGYVKEIKTDSNGLTKYAIIEPKVDFKHLDTILAIKNYNADEEEP